MNVTGPTLFAVVAMTCTASASVNGQEQMKQSQPGTQWTEVQIKQAVAPMRAGRKMTPERWPHGGRVAVCISWDMDNETYLLAAGTKAPIALSQGEYGARAGLPRIMELHDRHRIPGTFYIPAVTGLLYPEMIAELKKRPQHEVGVHGWIHEKPLDLVDAPEEERLLNKSISFLTEAMGKRPVGYRAPYWAFSPHTLDLIRKAGFAYDSSAMAMDEPYEIVSHDRPTGLVELPVSWVLDDATYFGMSGGALPSPEQVFKVFQDEFDRAYEEGTLFMLAMHPMITGHRSRMVHLDRLITYMKSKPGVWFATGREIAEYVKQRDGGQ